MGNPVLALGVTIFSDDHTGVMGIVLGHLSATV